MFGKIIAVTLLAVLVYAVAARSSSGAGHERIYVVKPYDTLWSIASTQYQGDPRSAIWKLRERNHLISSVLRPGQRLVVP
jgi:hypothetical protein